VVGRGPRGRHQKKNHPPPNTYKKTEKTQHPIWVGPAKKVGAHNGSVGRGTRTWKISTTSDERLCEETQNIHQRFGREAGVLRGDALGGVCAKEGQGTKIINGVKKG